MLYNCNFLFICKDDPDTLLKCLTIASEMLQGVATSGLNPTLTTLVQTLVICIPFIELFLTALSLNLFNSQFHIG